MSDEQPTSEDLTRWSRSFGAVAGTYDRGRPSYPTEAVSWLVGGEAKVVLELEANVAGCSAKAGAAEEKTFVHRQDVNRDSLVDIIASRSYVSSLDEAARQARLDKVRAPYDDYGRGHDGMQLAYRTECFRAQVVDGDPGATTEGPDDASHQGPIISDGTDTDMLLIDFR